MEVNDGALCDPRWAWRFVPLQIKYLYATGAPGELHGEPGYYLAMFESAVSYVRDFSRPVPTADGEKL